MRWTIREQLLVPLLVLLLGVAGISTWTALATARWARGQIESKVRDVARTLSESDFPLTERVLVQMRGLSGAEYLVVGDDGLRTSTLPAVPESLPSTESIGDDWRNVSLGTPVKIGDVSYLSSGLHLQRGPRPQTLFIFYPESLWRDALRQAVLPSVVLGIVGGGAALLLAFGVAQRFSTRVRELERRTRLIAAGDFSPMPLPTRDDEILDLCKSINEMAQKLAVLEHTVQTTERLRLLSQIGGGLAHQVRNAVTGARLAVQVHAQDCSLEDGDEALDVALRQLTLVETNLKRFLDLGRAESTRHEPCQLVPLLERTIELHRPHCKHTHTDLRWQPSQGVTVSGDEEQLGHLFSNILGNAVEAAGPNGWVEVRTKTQAGRAIIEVVDSGPGPPAHIADRLFEAFVTGKPEGVGLGLVVARRVAEAHGGRIDWRRDAGNTCFRIELPVVGP